MATHQEARAVLDRLHEDEPVFILRGQDMSAPETVRLWMRLNGLRCPPEKMEEAEALLERMMTWQEAHPELVKISD